MAAIGQLTLFWPVIIKPTELAKAMRKYPQTGGSLFFNGQSSPKIIKLRLRSPEPPRQRLRSKPSHLPILSMPSFPHTQHPISSIGNFPRWWHPFNFHIPLQIPNRYEFIPQKWPDICSKPWAIVRLFLWKTKIKPPHFWKNGKIKLPQTSAFWKPNLRIVPVVARLITVCYNWHTSSKTLIYQRFSELAH